MSTPPKRRVRIRDMPSMVVADDHTLSDSEREQSWWSVEDLNQVKDSVKRQCRSHRAHRRYSDCLTDAYRTACSSITGDGAPITDDSTSHSHSDSSDLVELQHDPANSEAISSPSSALAPSEGLLRLVSDEGPRGLECYSSRLHAIRRQRHLQATKHAVFLEQARQNITNEHDEELLARHCANASQRARSFATLLGQMDEYVAHKDETATAGATRDVDTSEIKTQELLHQAADDSMGETSS